MIQDEKLWNKLYTAAEFVYKHMDPEHGFDAGYKKEDDGSLTKIFNRYHACKSRLESKLGRQLNMYEQAILAIAVGDMKQACLRKIMSPEEINSISEDLWNNEPNREHVCLKFDRLITCI
jgi:hypothetical protein